MNDEERDRLIYETHTDVRRMVSALYGNGQPGALTDIAVLKTQMAERTQPMSKKATAGLSSLVVTALLVLTEVAKGLPR